MKPPKFLLNQRITIKGYVSNNSLGEKVYTNINGIDASMIVSSTPDGSVIILGRLEPTRSSVRLPNGEEKRFNAVMYTLGTDVPLQSTVIFENSKYIVTDCIKHFDLNGISYLEVLMS